MNKPRGCTSHDLCQKLKRIHPRKTKIGHSGTLDPLATGLIIIASHNDTKKLGELQGNPKKYRTTIDFSIITDTRDNDYYQRKELLKYDDSYLYTKQGVISIPSIEKVNSVLEQMRNIQSFQVPYFSAKKIQGKKMYEYARSGEYIETYTEMNILSFTMHSYVFPLLDISFFVSGGSYIRSFANYLSNELRTGGALIALKRTAIANFSL